jgi:hypothetical protein
MVIRRFNRYELKYVVHASRYQPLVDDLMRFLEPDEHGDRDGYYRVVSLYYDSPDYSFYHSKVDGLKFRRKLRVRVYPGDDIRTVKTGFVEIKQRMNRTVQKKRIVLPLPEAMALCNGDYDKPFADEMDAVAANEVLYMVRAMGLRPKCVVSYRRRALVGSRYENGMRVTFDMQLQGRVHALTLTENAHNHYFIPPDWYVLEVKVNERIPDWMTSIIARHECELRRVSKYCAALKNGMDRLKFRLEHREDIYE